MGMREDALQIIGESIRAVLPDASVRAALSDFPEAGDVYLVAIGKAAWQMARAACQALNGRVKAGVVVTKYGHAQGELPRVEIIEAGHPVPDENSVRGARRALALVEPLGEADRVLFLVSGGGSALFESPMPGVTLEDVADATRQLLACGADITEINAIRKHLSAVKGGRFAQVCAPARVSCVVLSDVIGDGLDSIASGPAHPDVSTSADALRLVDTYRLRLSADALRALARETPKQLANVEARIVGNVARLCDQAAASARALGYRPLVLTTSLDCEAREAGRFLASIARQIARGGQPLTPPSAVICGGETVVHLRGQGRGGRNQELALAAAEGIAGLENALIFSVGSDGTDGPTDAAGGMVDGGFVLRCGELGLSVRGHLEDNDAYPILEAAGGLIKTGPTGTNVNDLSVLLVGCPAAQG